MTKILFICHGNICRSPMAEFVFKDMVAKIGQADQFEIASKATSTEEIGNPVHLETRKKLKEHGISCTEKQAVQMKKQDYEYYDYLIGMDRNNIQNIKKITGSNGNKIRLLLEFAGLNEDIADPWYTGQFDLTYEDVLRGCQGLLDLLRKK